MNLWERQPNEGSRPHEAFELYLGLGTARSLEKVAQECSKSVSLLRRWSAQWSWVKRVEAHDKYISDLVAATREAEIKRVMSQGFANTHKRVAALNRLAVKLRKELSDKDKVWLPDAKTIGSGEDWERYEFTRFNAPLIEQFRATLDDLAKETGGRIKKTTATVTVIPKQYIGLDELEELDEAEDE